MDWLANGTKAVDFLKKYKYVALITLIGIFLMMIPEEKTIETQPLQDGIVQEENNLQDNLREILQQIEGAGKVDVLLAEASGQEIIYQLDEDKSISAEDSKIKKETVIITDSNRDETGLVSKIIAPIYQGAIVVCQGGDRAEVRLAIVEAVSRVTGLPSHQISVLKMK